MSNPLVSIIIPCYNYGHLISQTLDSLTKQTFKDWEALIIDDGSTDETTTIIGEYMTKDSRFKYHFQSNSGVSTARNHGIRLSTGSYIQFLDADDLLSPAKIEMQVNLLHENNEVMVSYCNSVQFGLNGNDLTNDINLENDTRLNMRQILTKNLVVSSPLIRKSAFKSLQFYEGMRYSEDWKFWIELILAGASFRKVGDPSCQTMIRIHENNSSTNRTSMLQSELDLKLSMFEKISNSGHLTQSAKKELYTFLKKNLHHIYKKLMVSGSLFDIKRLAGLYRSYGFFRFIKYYIKALNRKLKSSSNLSAPK